MLSRMNRCISIDSRGMPSANRISAVFSQDEYTSGVLETVMMSACRVTAQYPSSSNPADPRRCATHQTGAARRSSASSRAGTLVV